MALTTLVVMSGGCYYDNAEDLYPVDTIYVLDTTTTTDTTAVLSWSTDIQPIINTNCAFSGCHSANSSVRQPLTTHTEVKSAIENWALRLRVENGSMPPSGNLAASDKQALLDWIDAGYPDN
jgi:hypothetical protein